MIRLSNSKESEHNVILLKIQLPDQDEKVKWLTFSPVEQHFYRRQHEECAGTAMKVCIQLDFMYRSLPSEGKLYIINAESSSLVPRAGV